MFANGPGDWVSVLGWVIPQTQKIVLDATLINTQPYKVRIKSKVEQSREWSSPLHLRVVAIEKETFGSPLTKVTNFTFFLFFLSTICPSKEDKHIFPNYHQLEVPMVNGYRRRKWTWWHEFKPWTRLIAFHIVLIPLGKVGIQLFSLQLWVNRTD